MNQVNPGASNIMDIGVTTLATIKTDILEAIGEILPVALPVMGAILVIGIGVKVFKRFVK